MSSERRILVTQVRKPKRVSKAVLNKLKQVSTPTITTQLMSNHGLNNVSLRNVLPIDSKLGRFAGPAFTLRYVPIREDLHPQQYLLCKEPMH